MFNKNKKSTRAVKNRQAIRGKSSTKRNTKKLANRFNDVSQAMFKFIWKPKLLLSTSVIFVGLYIYNYANLDTVLPIQTLKIEGEFKFLNKKQLQKQAEPVVNGGFFNVNLSAVRKVLVNLPWVESVSVRRQWPDTLLVRVIEQKPVVLWGEDGVISVKGELFVPRVNSDLNLPHLFGPQGQHQVMLKELARMQAWLLETGLLIKNIELNARRSWILTMTSGMELRLGREQMHERLNRFVSVYKEKLQTEMQNKSRFKNAGREIKYVDMRYTNGFAVAWKEA